MANKLKAITTRAKQLYKTGHYKKWTDAIKAASKIIGSATGTRKVKAAAKKAKVRLPHGYKTVKAERLGTIAGHKSALKKLLEDDLARHLLKRNMYAKTKTEKKFLNKHIAAIRRQLKTL